MLSLSVIQRREKEKERLCEEGKRKDTNFSTCSMDTLHLLPVYSCVYSSSVIYTQIKKGCVSTGKVVTLQPKQKGALEK